MGEILMCPHDFDVALCYIVVKNVALSFSLIGHPCPTSCFSLQIILQY